MASRASNSLGWFLPALLRPPLFARSGAPPCRGLLSAAIQVRETHNHLRASQNTTREAKLREREQQFIVEKLIKQKIDPEGPEGRLAIGTRLQR